MTKYVFLKD